MPLMKVLDPDPYVGTGIEFEVWLDPGPPLFEGLCLGVGRTRESAMRNALDEVRRQAAELETLIKLGRHNVEV